MKAHTKICSLPRDIQSMALLRKNLAISDNRSEQLNNREMEL